MADGAGRVGIVDWRLAERTAAAVAAAGDSPPGSPDDEATLRSACDRAIAEASEYARIPVPAVWSPPEVVGRAEWSRNALATLAAAAAPIEERLASELRLPGPLAGLARTLIGVGAGAETGIVVGYAARRVLGQYDVALLGPERPPRLLFVGPNVEVARIELAADRALFLRWIALHETTHVLQLDGIPWLVPHLRELLRRLLEGAGRGVEPKQLGALARRFVREPRELVRELLRGELARLLADPGQEALLDRLQATMAVIEGHAEHVMDVCAADDPGLGELRARLDRRRARRGGLGEVVGRLIGIDVKLRQYELGKRFWDAIVAARGTDALEQAWASAEQLPDLAEVERPDAWLARTELAAAAR